MKYILLCSPIDVYNNEIIFILKKGRSFALCVLVLSANAESINVAFFTFI